MLKQYYGHMTTSKNTLLSKLCGLYNLHIRGQASRFIVMANVFPPGVPITRRYDLKGSTIGRTVGEDINKSGVILKDLDFIKTHTKLRVGPKYTEMLLEQIDKDSKFLEVRATLPLSFPSPFLLFPLPNFL